MIFNLSTCPNLEHKNVEPFWGSPNVHVCLFAHQAQAYTIPKHFFFSWMARWPGQHIFCLHVRSWNIMEHAYQHHILFIKCQWLRSLSWTKLINSLETSQNQTPPHFSQWSMWLAVVWVLIFILFLRHRFSNDNNSCSTTPCHHDCHTQTVK